MLFEPTIFNFSKDILVRAIVRDPKYYTDNVQELVFVVRDVCNALRLNSSKCILALRKDCDSKGIDPTGLLYLSKVQTSCGIKDTTVITLDKLVDLVVLSADGAFKFRHFMATEVLPAFPDFDIQGFIDTLDSALGGC